MVRRVRAAPVLPSPGVAFGPDYVRRLERLVVRLHSARERREGAGKSSLIGVGAEFVGYRPYRPGENLRNLDWNLLARLDRPFVRVARREASESWAILLDTSASMGVGVPGKLQSAAEIATAIAAIGLRLGATVELLTSDEGPPRSFVLRKKVQLPAWMAFLEDERAGGERGLAALVAEPARVRDAGRVFALGDFLDLAPEEFLKLARRGRELFAVQVLAPEELAPEAELGAVEWVDAESGARHTLEVDKRTRDRYERELGRRLEAWRSACGRHRAAYGCWPSTQPFEDVCTALLSP